MATAAPPGESSSTTFTRESMSTSKNSSGPAGALAALSGQLAQAVDNARQFVVAIHARRRIPSSGVMWQDGVVVSASHTVRRDDPIPITLPGGERVEATTAGRDPATDLIALRIQPSTAIVPTRAPAAADSEPPVGTLVLAVGRPGERATASFGIVSASLENWRTPVGVRVDRVLRLDLAVYDGFSGGVLVDAGGSILGLNNSALARGTPMAIPGPTVNRIVAELLERGHVQRPFIGVAVHPVALSAGLKRDLRSEQDSALL